MENVDLDTNYPEHNIMYNVLCEYNELGWDPDVDFLESFQPDYLQDNVRYQLRH